MSQRHGGGRGWADMVHPTPSNRLWGGGGGPTRSAHVTLTWGEEGVGRQGPSHVTSTWGCEGVGRRGPLDQCLKYLELRFYYIKLGILFFNVILSLVEMSSCSFISQRTSGVGGQSCTSIFISNIEIMFFFIFECNLINAYNIFIDIWVTVCFLQYITFSEKHS